MCTAESYDRCVDGEEGRTKSFRYIRAWTSTPTLPQQSVCTFLFIASIYCRSSGLQLLETSMHHSCLWNGWRANCICSETWAFSIKQFPYVTHKVVCNRHSEDSFLFIFSFAMVKTVFQIFVCVSYKLNFVVLFQDQTRQASSLQEIINCFVFVQWLIKTKYFYVIVIESRQSYGSILPGCG